MRTVAISESEMGNNPLFKKMYDRFICNGMTIGEIMLRKAEADTTVPVSPTSFTESPSVSATAPVSSEAKSCSSSLHSAIEKMRIFCKKNVTLLVAIIAILCAVTVICTAALAIRSGNKENAGFGENIHPAADITETEESAPVVTDEDYFKNIMDAYHQSFGDGE